MIEDKWNESFGREDFVYGTIANEFIKDHAHQFSTDSKIACLAEGEGRNAVHLARLGHDVTAYDVSEVGLEKSEKLAQNNNVSIETEKLNLIEENLPHERYDNAILVYGHVHKDDQPKLINNMIQTVKKDGLIMFEVYSTDQINYKTGGPGKTDYLYDPKTILDLIEPYKVLHFYYGETERYEGLRHNGLGHVIQVIIQK